jgi:chitodextrinase
MPARRKWLLALAGVCLLGLGAGPAVASASGSPSAGPLTEGSAVRPSPSPSGTTAGGCAAAWSASTSYSPGDIVSGNGDNWTSTWWSTGAEPFSPVSWNTWTDDGSC